MFSGSIGKQMMIAQGYVPEGCTLDDQLAGPLIFAEVTDGRDPCAGCTENRAKCGGRPPRNPLQIVDIADTLDQRQMRQMDEREDERRRAKANPMPNPWEEKE